MQGRTLSGLGYCFSHLQSFGRKPPREVGSSKTSKRLRMPKNVDAVLTHIFKWQHEFIYMESKKASRSRQWRAIPSCFIMDLHILSLKLGLGISQAI